MDDSLAGPAKPAETFMTSRIGRDAGSRMEPEALGAEFLQGPMAILVCEENETITWHNAAAADLLRGKPCGSLLSRYNISLGEGEQSRTSLVMLEPTVGDGLWSFVAWNKGSRRTIVRILEVDDYVRSWKETAYREDIWRHAVEAADHGVWEYNAANEAQFYSLAWKTMRGFQADQEICDTLEKWEARLHPEDRERVMDYIRRQNNGERSQTSIEYRERRQDGRWIWILARGRTLEWDEHGRPSRLVGTDIDITGIKELEAARTGEAEAAYQRHLAEIEASKHELRLQNERFDVALESMKHGLCMCDAENRLLIANTQFAAMYGLPRELLVPGTPLSDLFNLAFGDTKFAAKAAMQTAAALCRVERGQGLEDRTTLPDGRTIEFSIQRLTDGGWVAVHRDITAEIAKARALKEAEDVLRRRTDQLIEAQKLGKIGDWSYRFGERDVWWSREIYELLGYDPERFRSTRDDVIALYMGDGAHRVLETQSEVVRTGQVRSVDVKARKADGAIGDFVVTSKALTDETGNIIGVFGTIQDISERKFAEEQLTRLAYYDPLTGLANRSLFRLKLEELLERHPRNGSQSALLLLDLDRFKDVNDALGHAVGDELLSDVARLLKSALPDGSFIARLGGDEFAVLLEVVRSRQSVESIAERLIAAVTGTRTLGLSEVFVGTSVGIALVPDHGSSATELLRNADLALYRAKDEGRGRQALFDSCMNDEVQQKIELGRELRRALTDDLGLSVHYQPQLDLSTNTVRGYEALARWNHPTRGFVSPAEFIPVAERSHLITDIGNWVLLQAARQGRKWLDMGEPPREIAVNMSVAQIWNTDVVEDVRRVLRETGLPPHLLCLELTESLFADHDRYRVREALAALKRIGVKLALDDFGTGYSSLGYLTQLPFDKLKIDRVFVRGATSSDHSYELLKGIVALGRGLGMTVVAEGAESHDEVAILREFGCDVVQGFVFSRPAPANEAMAFTHTHEGQKFDHARIPPERKGGAEIGAEAAA